MERCPEHSEKELCIKCSPAAPTTKGGIPNVSPQKYNLLFPLWLETGDEEEFAVKAQLRYRLLGFTSQKCLTVTLSRLKKNAGWFGRGTKQGLQKWNRENIHPEWITALTAYRLDPSGLAGLIFSNYLLHLPQPSQQKTLEALDRLVRQ